MMLKRTATLALLLCLGPGVQGGQESEWIKVAPIGGGFSVMMPVKPEEEMRPGNELTTHLFVAKTDEALYIVAYGDYAPSVRLNPDEELMANRDKFLTGLDAGLIESKKITVEGRQGIEFTGESDQATFRSRVFIFGIRFHQIAVALFKGKENRENANRFFASFQFTKSEARPKP